MMQGNYYKEWSAVLDREMEFKVYGRGGAPVLALPARGGRFYDWENNGMPDAAARLINDGKIQLFCADSVDGGGLPSRRRAELQEKYFNYLTRELPERILSINASDGEKVRGIWCVGVDAGAYEALLCRLRRPEAFIGVIGLSGLYDAERFFGADSSGDDLVLRNDPFLLLREDGLINKTALASDKNAVILCAGQGGSENDALTDTRALSAELEAQSIPAHTEIWGGDVSHDWYWWGREWGIFSERIFA